MSFRKLVFAAFFSVFALATQSMAQSFSNYVTFDWTQYNTNTSYRAQGGQVGGDSYNTAVYNVTYYLDGRAQSAEVSVRRGQRGVVNFNFLNRRNNAVCPGSARWQGNAYYGSMSCRSGQHSVVLYL